VAQTSSKVKDVYVVFFKCRKGTVLFCHKCFVSPYFVVVITQVYLGIPPMLPLRSVDCWNVGNTVCFGCCTVRDGLGLSKEGYSDDCSGLFLCGVSFEAAGRRSSSLATFCFKTARCSDVISGIIGFGFAIASMAICNDDRCGVFVWDNTFTAAVSTMPVETALATKIMSSSTPEARTTAEATYSSTVDAASSKSGDSSASTVEVSAFRIQFRKGIFPRPRRSNVHRRVPMRNRSRVL
jgi:hypothetical protein